MRDVTRLTAADIARRVRTRSLSAVDVTQAHLARLDQVNPAINAVVQDNRADALSAAQVVDDAITRGEDPGSLAGVPVTIKVTVDQAGHATTNGLTQQSMLVAEQDSPVVASIRNAGGIILGRTNTPAFSTRWFTNNGLHGQTLNPHDAGITPGGSSGGASAAVAAGLCAIGHGTDIAGSVRYPAYACGLHGLRPSHGRVPAYNASGPDRFLGAQLMAVSGPIARSIEDIGLALDVLSTPSVMDPWYTPADLAHRPFEKRAALTLAPDDMPVAASVKTALTKAAKILEEDGWEIEEITCPPMREAARVNALLWMADTQFGQAEMIAREQDADAQFVFEMMSRDTGPVGFDTLMRALQTRATLVREWEVFLQRYPVLLCPISGELPFDQQLDVRSEADFWRVYEAQLTQRGLPVMGMPALALATGIAEGRPVGVQLVSGKFREDILLCAGAVIEAANPLPTVVDPR